MRMRWNSRRLFLLLMKNIFFDDIIMEMLTLLLNFFIFLEQVFGWKLFVFFVRFFFPFHSSELRICCSGRGVSRIILGSVFWTQDFFFKSYPVLEDLFQLYTCFGVLFWKIGVWLTLNPFETPIYSVYPKIL